jgi:2-oxoglutarate ferredoxin oxidoreductase subunit alpha
MVHGGGHGDYHPIVLAPASVQEAIDLTVLAFDLAEKYRCIVVVMADGNIGQMMEPAELPPMKPLKMSYPDWATRGAQGRERRILSSIYIDPKDEEVTNYRLMKTWEDIQASEIRYKEYYLDNPDIAVVGYGTAGRISLSAVRAARDEGLNVGLFRPISLSPFPYAQIEALADKVKSMLVVEMNAGQMLDDVLRATKGRIPVEFYGRMGGMVPFPDEVLDELHRMASQPLKPDGDARKRWLQRFGPVIHSNN